MSIEPPPGMSNRPDPIRSSALAFLQLVCAEADALQQPDERVPAKLEQEVSRVAPSYNPQASVFQPVRQVAVTPYAGHFQQLPVYNPQAAMPVGVIIPNTRVYVEAGGAACFICGMPGHWRSNCPARRCAVCWQVGHLNLKVHSLNMLTFLRWAMLQRIAQVIRTIASRTNSVTIVINVSFHDLTLLQPLTGQYSWSLCPPMP
jgi:hypothetical protein